MQSLTTLGIWTVQSYRFMLPKFTSTAALFRRSVQSAVGYWRTVSPSGDILHFLLGPAFLRQPAIAGILSDETLAGGRKMLVVINGLISALQARQRSK